MDSTPVQDSVERDSPKQLRQARGSSQYSHPPSQASLPLYTLTYVFVCVCIRDALTSKIITPIILDIWNCPEKKVIIFLVISLRHMLKSFLLSGKNNFTLYNLLDWHFYEINVGPRTQVSGKLATHAVTRRREDYGFIVVR